MARFEYGLASYLMGTLEADVGSMSDVAVDGPFVGIRDFFKTAGEKGWEFCGLLPTSSLSQEIAVFKRCLD